VTAIKRKEKRYRWANAPGLVDNESTPPADAPSWFISRSYMGGSSTNSTSEEDNGEDEEEDDGDYEPGTSSSLHMKSTYYTRAKAKKKFGSSSGSTSRAAANVAMPRVAGKNINTIISIGYSKSNKTNIFKYNRI
jgi:hypothetical protein